MRVMRPKKVKIFPLRRVAVGEQEEVLKHSVLPDQFRSAAPLDELEFGNPPIGLEIEPHRAACPCERRE
jgi:hypothetical protein